jgi:membrane protein
MIKSLQAHIDRLLWEKTKVETRVRRAIRMPARIIYAVARDLAEGQLTLRAMSLVYTTLLSVVPLIAFSLSVLKGFGVHRTVEPLLFEFLQPLGDQGGQITERIVEFVDNTRGDVLGGVGLTFLLFTVIIMVQKIEDTFNYIWQVQKSRSAARRFSDYLSVILIGPVLIITATGLIATITASEAMEHIARIRPFGSVLAAITQLAPFMLVVGVFAFFYGFVPNTRVRPRAALAGALLAGTGWTLGGSLFTAVIVGSTRYAAIYSSFAIVLFALIWLYLSWLILLIGAQVAYYVQYPRRMRAGRSLRLSIAQIERLALGIMVQIGRGFDSGVRPDFRMLAHGLDHPAGSLEEITSRLEAAGLVVLTKDGTFVPGRPPDAINLADVLAAVRGVDPLRGDGTVDALVSRIRAAEAEYLGEETLADVLAADRLVAGDGHSAEQQ